MSDGSGFSALAQMLPALALIVGALLLVKRWARRGGRVGSTDGVKILSRTGLTRGAILAIVEVGGKRYLVGAGEHGVRMLTELETEVIGNVGGGVPVIADSPNAAAMDSQLPSSAGAGQTSRPWMGFVGRLQAMTVRSYPSGPPDVVSR